MIDLFETDSFDDIISTLMDGVEAAQASSAAAEGAALALPLALRLAQAEQQQRRQEQQQEQQGQQPPPPPPLPPSAVAGTTTAAAANPDAAASTSGAAAATTTTTAALVCEIAHCRRRPARAARRLAQAGRHTAARCSALCLTRFVWCMHACVYGALPDASLSVCRVCSLAVRVMFRL